MDLEKAELAAIKPGPHCDAQKLPLFPGNRGLDKWVEAQLRLGNSNISLAAKNMRCSLVYDRRDHCWMLDAWNWQSILHVDLFSYLWRQYKPTTIPAVHPGFYEATGPRVLPIRPLGDPI